MKIPQFITHYHSAEDPPFRNLSEVAEDQRDAVISMLVERRRQDPNFHRVFGAKYIPFRLATEKKMRRKFIESGGKPERDTPHYFVLGASNWFNGLYPASKSVSISLSDLRETTTSITYPDSFTSMRLGEEYGVPLEPIKPYHEEVYLLSELSDLVSKYGVPADEQDADYSNYVKEPFEKYIEVQVWSDTPVERFLLKA